MNDAQVGEIITELASLKCEIIKLQEPTIREYELDKIKENYIYHLVEALKLLK